MCTIEKHICGKLFWTKVFFSGMCLAQTNRWRTYWPKILFIEKHFHELVLTNVYQLLHIGSKHIHGRNKLTPF